MSVTITTAIAISIREDKFKATCSALRYYKDFDFIRLRNKVIKEIQAEGVHGEDILVFVMNDFKSELLCDKVAVGGLVSDMTDVDRVEHANKVLSVIRDANLDKAADTLTEALFRTEDNFKVMTEV